MNDEIEIWKAIPGWSGEYEVSNFGNVRSMKSGVRVLKPHVKRNGYLGVNLHLAGRREQLKIHRLVLITFVGAPPEDADGCHNNGIRSDNRLSNLRWDTRLGNQADRRLHETNLAGVCNPSAKLTEAEVIEIRESSLSYSKLAEKFGMSKSGIKKIKDGKSWKSLK